LNDIGFEWPIVERNDWKVMYQRLLKYKEKHGTAHVPSSYEASPQLAHWVYTQRHSCKNKDQINLLDDIGFVWNPKGPSDVDTEDYIII